MKFISLFILSLFSLSSFANDQSLCEYLKKTTLEEFNGQSFKPNKSFSELIGKVSKELDKKRETACKEGSHFAIYDQDFCNSQCVKHGSSETRVKALILTKGLVDLNEKTRDCQKLCNVYQEVVFAYKHGFKEGSKSSDCSEHISSTARNIVKDIGSSEKTETKQSSSVTKE
jgi:hypothetical protein